MPQICYDLRFPVWNRNRYNNLSDEFDYDLLVFVANWPAPRTTVWDSLLKARALENQCIAIGVNRTGSDGEGIAYDGHSVVYNFKGEPMNTITDQPSIESVELNLEELQAFRKKFPVYLDWDKFDVDLT
jgi:predicted amidohydrolase